MVVCSVRLAWGSRGLDVLMVSPPSPPLGGGCGSEAPCAGCPAIHLSSISERWGFKWVAGRLGLAAGWLGVGGVPRLPCLPAARGAVLPLLALSVPH